MRRRERNLSELPMPLLAGLLLFFSVQLVHHHSDVHTRDASYERLDAPLSATFYRSISLGSDQLLSYLLILSLQMHDNQKGQHVSYSHLDYQLLSDWLLTIYELNPLAEYPAFLASRVYSLVHSESKVRAMIAVVEKLFEINPQQHWRRMTEVCLILKHQLNDLPAALKVAEQIAALPKSVELPHWARDMRLVLLDELNQQESAQLLISSMLQSGEITDRDEVRFLEDRLLKIQQELSKNKQSGQSISDKTLGK